MKHASLLKCIAVGYQPLYHCWKPTLEIVVLEYMVRWRFHFFKRIITIFGKAIQFDEWLNHQLESARKIGYPFWSRTKRFQNSCIFVSDKETFQIWNQQQRLQWSSSSSLNVASWAASLNSSWFNNLKKHGRCQVLGVVQATEWCCPPKLAHFYSTLAGVRVKLRIESSMLEVCLEVKLKVMSRFQAPGLSPEVVCMCLCRSLCPIRRDRLEQLASMVGGGVLVRPACTPWRNIFLVGLNRCKKTRSHSLQHSFPMEN